MARLGPGHSRKAGFPGGWAWEDSVGTGCGGADEYVSPLVVGCGGLALHASILTHWLCDLRQKS